MSSKPDTSGGVALLAKAREKAAEGFTIWRTWGEVSGETPLGFHFSIIPSESYANRREAMIGASAEEKGQLFRNFKTETVAEALAAPPIGITDFPPPGALAPDATPEQRRADLRRRALEFFDTRDGEGNQILWFLVESLFREYWERALPDTFPKEGKDTSAAASVSQPAT